MLELGCRGFQQTDTALMCYFEKRAWSEPKFESLKKELRGLFNIISVNTVVRFNEIEEKNWNEEWERSLTPIQIGERLVVRPTWSTFVAEPGQIEILIDPKMSFGTGYHETTRLTLLLLEKHLVPDSDVLDVGTGTGILAIAAVKLGARCADAIDIDDWSIENAMENSALNGTQEQVRISKRNLSDFSPRSFDLITANLTLNTNLELLPEFQRVLRPKGFLLLSGLLNESEPAMRTGLRTHGFHPITIQSENEWIAIASSCES